VRRGNASRRLSRVAWDALLAVAGKFDRDRRERSP
jgi:hypothetical protein